MAEGRALELLISYLKDRPMSHEPEKYSELLSSLQGHPLKSDILSSILSNIDNTTVFLSIAPAYFKPDGVEDTPSVVLRIIEKSKELCDETRSNYDMFCKILFKCLESKKIQIEIKSTVFKIFEEVEFRTHWIRSNALAMLHNEHTVNILTEILLYISAIRRSRCLDSSTGPEENDKSKNGAASYYEDEDEHTLPDVLEYLLKESEISKNTTLQKNYSSLILRVCESIREHGIEDTIRPLLESISSEIQCIRNSAIESAVVISKGLKKKIEEERKGEKELSTVLTAVLERTVDVSPFCRARAIQSLTEILSTNGLLEGIKEKVYTSVHERIMDKTQMVRRKAIVFFKRALENHPYALDGGTLAMHRLEKHKDANPSYYASAVTFYHAIHQSVEIIKQLLKAGSKGEITEIVQYVSLCYSYGMDNALEVFPDLFLLSWQRIALDGKNTADILSEELRRMADGSPKKLIELLLHFDADTLSYEGIIRELSLRGILGIEVLNTIFYKIDQNSGNVISYLRLFRRITATDRAVTESALDRIMNILKTSTEVPIVTEIVRILGNLDYRVGNTSEIITAVMHTLSAVDENNLELLQAVIDTSYLVSTDPDALAVEVLTVLTEKKQLIPLIFAVGHIAIKEAVHLERVEAAWNHQTKKNTTNKKRKESISTTAPEIRERRLSVGSKRNSMKNTTEEQEEMADRIFFAKEHEILFGEVSALKGCMDVVVSGVRSAHPLIRRVSLLSLGKIMSVSSECNSRYMNEVVEIMKTGSDDLKIIALVIISDSIMAFSSLVKDAGCNLFIPLRSDTAEVKKTALVLIRHLLRSGMVKVKDNYWTLSLLLLEEAEIKSTTQKLFEEAAERESGMKVVCEVIKSYLIDRYAQANNKVSYGTAADNDTADADNVINGADNTENTENKGNSYHTLAEVVKAVVKIAAVNDFSRKLMDWASSKNDPVVSEICTFITEEISRTATIPA
ncbi:hypothetical protein NEMIN01_1625 [Nematocida minor]|uniref:uncharacterized protein n=1 Tax=Nematocida minor TaxID=1912983 RepID=UPI00221F49D1|nr:uncharacterized protein NEMIN01_1625 [Nematocida minor]KAI5191692.1 hypothetical protein NEMIN01_1625 [Nematocida minor]